MADETEKPEEKAEAVTEESTPEASEAPGDASTDTSSIDVVTAEAPAEEAPAEEATVEEAPAAATAPAAPQEDGERPNRRKVREGVVVSDAMQSTVVVAVVERVRHPRYGKTVQRTKKLYVHDAEDTAKVGDRVRVQETRPLSKLKRWRLTEVVERAR
jgi:small subunit ribosomal protein S17